MRDWIKNHPWRLEIIPLTAFIMAVVFPLLYQAEAAPLMKPQHGFFPAQTWLIIYCTVIMVMAESWFLGIVTNHSHVVSERESKRFNYWAIIWTAQIVTLGLISTLWLLLRVCPWWVIVSWMILLLATAIVQPRLEKARPFHPKPTIPDVDLIIPPETTTQGTCLYYREVIGNKSTLFVNAMLVFGLWFMWWEGGVSLLTATLLLGLVLTMTVLAQFWKTTFTIAENRVSVAFALTWRTVSIPLDTINRCTVEVQDPNESRRIIRNAAERTVDVVDLRSASIISEMVGNYNPDISLKVETTGSQDYAFRLHDPEKACAVINALIAAKQE